MSLLHYSIGGEYELAFSAWGKGVLGESDLLPSMLPEAGFSAFRERFGREPREISLTLEDSSGFGYWFSGVDAVLLEKLDTLRELVLPDTVTHLDKTPRLEAILRENDTLIRGGFDSFAQRFAAENGLRFRPADYAFAFYLYEPVQESTTVELVFRRNGSVQIKEEVSSPGSSAGNTFGGSFFHDLAPDFYRTETAETIARRFRGAIRGAILEQGRLAAFLEKAKAQGYYTGKN